MHLSFSSNVLESVEKQTGHKEMAIGHTFDDESDVDNLLAFYFWQKG